VIQEHTKLTEPLKECLISALTNARDFDEAEAVISQLKEYKLFSKEQASLLASKTLHYFATFSRIDG
jgi:pentatricopeptide repeat protein